MLNIYQTIVRKRCEVVRYRMRTMRMPKSLDGCNRNTKRRRWKVSEHRFVRIWCGCHTCKRWIVLFGSRWKPCKYTGNLRLKIYIVSVCVCMYECACSAHRISGCWLATNTKLERANVFVYLCSCESRNCFCVYRILVYAFPFCLRGRKKKRATSNILKLPHCHNTVNSQIWMYAGRRFWYG